MARSNLAEDWIDRSREDAPEAPGHRPPLARLSPPADRPVGATHRTIDDLLLEYLLLDD